MSADPLLERVSRALADRYAVTRELDDRAALANTGFRCARATR